MRPTRLRTSYTNSRRPWLTRTSHQLAEALTSSPHEELEVQLFAGAHRRVPCRCQSPDVLRSSYRTFLSRQMRAASRHGPALIVLIGGWVGRKDGKTYCGPSRRSSQGRGGCFCCAERGDHTEDPAGAHPRSARASSVKSSTRWSMSSLVWANETSHCSSRPGGVRTFRFTPQSQDSSATPKSVAL